MGSSIVRIEGTDLAQSETFPALNGLNIKDIHLLGKDDWIVAGKPVPEGNTGAVLITSDSGKSWESVDIPLTEIQCLRFLDNSTGFAGGPAGLAVTKDSGISWELISEEKDCDFSCFRFIDINRGFAVNRSSGMLKTDDGGHSWQKVEALTGAILTNIAVYDELKCWAVGLDGVFFSSEDGGKSWERFETGVVTDFFSVVPITTRYGVIAGSNGTFLKVESIQ